MAAELGTSQGTVRGVAVQLGDAVELVRSGVCQADIDDGVKVAITTGEQTRMKELE